MSAIRQPAVAGRFYPADPDECRKAADGLIKSVSRETAQTTAIGGLVPHAGWHYSGQVAARTIAACALSRPDVWVIFGAVHVQDRNLATIYPEGSWITPAADFQVDSDLVSAVALSAGIVVDPSPHAYEHSIEVELPIIAAVAGGARILPVMVRPGTHAADVGLGVARACARLGRKPVFLASTDLTHYGPAFGFEPHGRGEAGLRWAKDSNDRHFITRALACDAAGVVASARDYQNACGAGAVSAAIAAVCELGRIEATELVHRSSAEWPVDRWKREVNSVGYVSATYCLA